MKQVLTVLYLEKTNTNSKIPAQKIAGRAEGCFPPAGTPLR